MTAAQAVAAMHPVPSRVLLALIPIPMSLAGVAPVWAHGSTPHAASRIVVSKPAEQIDLPAVNTDDHRLRGCVSWESGK
jgi:hypothetical protein